MKPMEPAHLEGEKKERREPVQPGTVAVQGRALDAVRETGGAIAGARLLESTGPLAELSAADKRGVLDEARRVLIAKKGSGVVFEAITTVQLQEANERYSIGLTARLAATATNPRTDILVTHAGIDIELQLKTGDKTYIRSALRQQVDGVKLLVPADAAEGAAMTALEFEGVTLETPTKEQLYQQTERTLDRLSAGEPIVTFADAAKRALTDCLVDAVVVAVLDLASQVMEQPNEPIDWRRTGKAVLKATATTVVTSLLATANTATAMKAAGRAVEVASIARGTRAAAALVPHAIDLCIDVVKVSSGEMSRAEFIRSSAGHTGAAAAEYFAFPYIARLASRLGPLGSIIAMVAGGMLVAYLGRKAGEAIHDLAVDFFVELPAGQQVVEGKVIETIVEIEKETTVETARRAKKAEKRQCEEPRCAKPHHARGMCKRHYNRWWRRQRRVSWRLYSWALVGPGQRPPVTRRSHRSGAKSKRSRKS